MLQDLCLVTSYDVVYYEVFVIIENDIVEPY